MKTLELVIRYKIYTINQRNELGKCIYSLKGTFKNSTTIF